MWRRRCAWGWASKRSTSAARSTPGSSNGSPRSSRSKARCALMALPPDAGNMSALEGERLLRRASRSACRQGRSRRHRGSQTAWRSAGVQAHRHLRRRVRVAHGLYVLDLRGSVRRQGPMRSRSFGARKDRHPRRRPEPDRAGDRVRLLLLPRLVLAERGGLRDDHDQLQSGDRLDRLRHLGPALFRAADRRGRAGHSRQGARAWAPQGRDRAVRRPDAAETRPCHRTVWRADPRHLGRLRSISRRTATASSDCSTSSA